MALERPPAPKYGNPEMLKRFRPGPADVQKFHTVTNGRTETLASAAQANHITVEALVAFNFPGAVENGKIIPEVVNWYLSQHAEFRCPETADRRNRAFKGGEKLAIPKSQAAAGAVPAAAQFPPSLQPHLAKIRSEIKSEQQKYWKEFEDAVSKDFGTASSIVSILEPALGGAETLRQMKNMFIGMRVWGCSAADIFAGFKVLATDGKGAPSTVVKIVTFFSTESPKRAQLIKGAKLGGFVAAFLGIALNSAIGWGRGDYHIVAVELYKFAIATGVPLAGLLDTFQSLIGSLFPTANTDRIFKYFRAVNPIAMGGIAIDSLGAVIQCFIAEKGNEQRLARLTERMRDAGAGVLVELGDKSGDALYDLTHMSDAEFHEAVGNLGPWLKSLVGR